MKFQRYIQTNLSEASTADRISDIARKLDIQTPPSLARREGGRGDEFGEIPAAGSLLNSARSSTTLGGGFADADGLAFNCSTHPLTPSL